MKTFEEELKHALKQYIPMFENGDAGVQAPDALAGAILVAHQAEMDNVVFQVIGDHTEPIEDTDDEVDRCNNQNFLISEQRARYKAIKEGK